MKKMLRICLGITLVEFIAAIAVWSFLPETIPTHWGISGEIDAYGSKWMIFLAPALSLGLTIGMYYLPKIDPKGENITRSGRAYPTAMLLVNVIMVVVLTVTIIASLGFPVMVGKIIPAAIGVMFLFIGNYMPKIKPNYFFGIRLPWTLADESVWTKTHRLGGWVFLAIGLLFIGGIFLPSPFNFIMPMVSIGIGVGGIAVYSYAQYTKRN